MDLNVLPEKEMLSAHRYDECDPWSEDESSLALEESSLSPECVSSDTNIFCQTVQNCFPPKYTYNHEINSKDELGLDDLPPIEEVSIVISKEDMMLIGRIHSVFQNLVIVQGEQKKRPVDVDSVLFIAPDKPLGRVFDVFGPIIEPYYCVRFNSMEEIKEKNLTIGQDIFFAPERNDITSYVLIDEETESDASWENNNEPPKEHLDFSDDDQGEEAKHKRMSKFRQGQFSHSDVPAKETSVEYKSQSQQTQTSELQTSEKVTEVQQNAAAGLQPPPSQFQNQRSVGQNQEPLVKPQHAFQLTNPFNNFQETQIRQPVSMQPSQLPQVPYHQVQPCIEAQKLFEAQVPEIQHLPVKQQISIAASCFSMAKAASRANYKTPVQQYQAHVFQPSHFPFQEQRSVQLAQTSLVNQQPFKVQMPFQHSNHINNFMHGQLGQPGLIQPLQQPLLPYLESHNSFQTRSVATRQFGLPAPNLFQTEVLRIQQQIVRHQTFSNFPGTGVSPFLN